jgi:RNA polymerase sigma-70 factor (ECF subfamily)
MFFSNAIPGTLPAQQEGRRERGHAVGAPVILSEAKDLAPPAPEKATQSQGTDSAALSGDVQALGLLYERFRRPIYSYTYRLLGNREDAADVTQDVFVRLCVAWEKLRDRDHLGVWLHHVATNLCLDLLRQRKRLSWWPLVRRNRNAEYSERVGDDDPFSFLPPDDGGIPEIAEREHIQLALAAIPKEYAIILLLNVAQGIPYHEIATIVGLSPTAAAARISRAKKMFVEQYQRLSKEGVGTQEKRL